MIENIFVAFHDVELSFLAAGFFDGSCLGKQLDQVKLSQLPLSGSSLGIRRKMRNKPLHLRMT